MSAPRADELRTVIAHLCENDDRGMPSGKVSGVDFADATSYDAPPCLELETTFCDDDLEADGPECERRGRFLFVGASSYFVRGFRPHVGNIYWNGYALSLYDARRLVRYLIEKESFAVQAADIGNVFDDFAVRAK